MAARQRTMSTRAQVVEPTYEDFQPKSEWVEEAATNVLTVHLPGFTSNQIKITYIEKPPKMTIRGERLLGNNVVSRFSQEFPIPEDCKLNEMKATFDHEVLTITMPKKVIASEIAQPKEAAPMDQKPQPGAPSSPGAAATDRTKPPPAKPQEEKVSSTPKSTTAAAAAAASAKEPEKKTDEKVTAPAPDPAQIPSPSLKAPGLPEPKPQKETPAKATGQKQADDQVPQPFHPLEDTSRPKSQSTQEETSSKTPPVSDVQKPRHDQKETEHDPKPVEQKVEHGEKAPKEKEKDRAKSREPPSQVFERIGKEAVDLAAAGERTAVGLEEDRKVLMNAGVALLVIVAVGAYVGYKLASPSGSHHSNN